ncbi:MAG: zinc-ribbon domain-containing protein [Burkholderiales bacterium]|nr:zinc-ribbon domain-containing protein [Burkholderiales bacterium]
MSLATRCTECGTVFRVVQDQLKVSEGWVRCGRCSAVFNALENLCEIDGDRTEAPAAQPPFDPNFVAPGAPEAPDAPEPTSSFPETETPYGANATTLPFDDGPDAIVEFSAASPTEPAPPDDAPAMPAGATTLAEPAPAGGDHPPLVAEGAPHFVRAAERAAFWRRRPVRITLVVSAVLLSVLLALQAALAGRNLLAAHMPGTRPLLAELCRHTGCTIQPLRRIDKLSVDSSGLAKVEGAALYRLSVVLHNRGDIAVLAPALDLSLTDAAGKLVARRVLQTSDLGLSPVIDAGQELPLQALLSTGEHRITGYTVELFYP